MKIATLDESHYEEVIADAVAVLEAGGVVVVPTDTVYGLAVDATSDAAVKKLINLKSRPPGKAISIFVENVEKATNYVNISSDQQKMLQHLFPGQYTVVLPSKGRTSSLLESENHTLGIRVPDNTFINRLIAAFGKPLTATSANMASQSPHFSIDSLLGSLSERKKNNIDLVINAGTLPRRKPSTVVDLTGGDITILRQGDATVESGTSETYTSVSQKNTQEIARELIVADLAYITKKPLVILLYGELGAGKTEFVKGIGSFFGIHNIISPTFVIYYEYPIEHKDVKFLYHFDLYRLMSSEEFAHLGIDDLLLPGNILCIEWSEKASSIIKDVEKKAHIIEVHMNHVSEEERHIIIKRHI